MPNSFEQTRRQSRSPHYLVTIIAWLILVILVGAVYLWYSGYMQSKKFAPVSSGYIFLNLKTSGKNSHLYLFNVSTGALEQSPVQAFAPSISVDHRYVVGSQNTPQNAGSAGGIYLYDLVSQASTLIAPSKDQFPLFAQQSPDDIRSAFNQYMTTKIASQASVPSSWGIYIASTSSAPQLIAQGLYPRWSPDGASILYLGDDGLHLYSLHSATDMPVWPLNNGSASSRMMLSISEDGKMLAWTNPLHQEIVVAHIVSWSPFEFKIVDRITDIYGFWPIFSPDDTTVAFEQVDWDIASSNALPVHPRLVVYNVVSNQPKTVLDLSSYDQTTIFMSGWVNNL